LSRQTDKQKRTILKVYLDDERAAPEGWHRVYWPEEAIELLRTGMVEVISLDHDLGDDERGTGYDVVTWIEEQVVTAGFIPPEMRVHSANVSARTKMELGIRSIERLAKR
jgi:hypothetical protein